MNPIIPNIIITAAFFGAAAAAHAENTYSAGRLNNGLAYHIVRVPSEPGRVEVRLQVGVGASDENGTSEIGVAHMVEHMVFRRAPKYPNGVGDTLISQGWRRGANFNAMTNYERTLYSFSPSKGKVQLAETLEALSAMVSPHPFSQADWDKEKQVIEAEWRNGLGVSERMNRQRTAIIRSGSRQARYGIVGTQESIRDTPVSVLQDFHQRWYVPNNMQIMIAGDITSDQAESLLNQYFGHLKTGTLPDRSSGYYEPKLQPGWHVAQLQDKDSGGSFTAVLFRLNNAPSRDYRSGGNGSRERMIERFAAYVLAQRLKNEIKYLPKTVSTITARKTDIGRETVAIGLVASVTPDGHKQGLAEILQLRERILREPVTQQEFGDYMATMQQAVAKAKQKTTLPEPFGDVVQSVSENAFNGKPVRTPAEHAVIIDSVLKTLRPSEITARLRQWLNADDKLVQIQAPSLMEITDFPSAAQIEADAEALKTAKLPKLRAKAAPGQGAFSAKTVKGKITGERYDKSLKITRWTLQNGDKVVVLNHPTANGQTYLQAFGEMGFMNGKLNPWQSQLAQQIIWQSAPQGWSNVQLNEWKKTHKINLSMSLRADDSKLEGSAPDKEAENLFRLYQAYMATPQVGEDYRDAIMSMIRRLPMEETSSRAAKEKAVTDLRFGGKAYAPPSQLDLEETEEPQLLAQWQVFSQAPVTYYILTNQPPHRLKPLVAHYLAAIHRTPLNSEAARAGTHPALHGVKVERKAVNAEARTDVAHGRLPIIRGPRKPPHKLPFCAHWRMSS